MANLSKFKNQKKKFDALRDKLKKQQNDEGGAGYDDSWKFRPKMTPGSTKDNFVIRFLPHMAVDDGEGEFWAEGYVHIFQRNDGKKVYTLCPKRSKKDKAPCPICEKAGGLYDLVNAGAASKADEDMARMYYKKQRYFANVLVVSDPRTGDDNQEGQVLVFEYGNQIQEKITDAILDQDIDPHNPFTGRNFNLVIKKKGDFVTYESSHFSMKETELADSEEAIESVLDKAYNLEEKVFGDTRDYDSLKALLTGKKSESNDSDTEDDIPSTEEKKPRSRTRDTDNDGQVEDDASEGEFEDVASNDDDDPADDDDDDNAADDDLDIDDDELFE